MTTAENIMLRSTKDINTNEVTLTPCGRRIIFLQYDENPYRVVNKTESGFIYEVEGTKRYLSNDSGEMEENDEMVVCAKVIAVGPDAKYVKEGDDIFVMKGVGATPVPFRKKGYHIIDEMNVLCVINDNNGNR